MPAILLVDDVRDNLVALRAILEPLEHELVEASSGEEALRILLARDDFAVILLDVQMPGLDGFETAELIKERERTSTIPIIFLTAISKEEQHVFRGYAVGAVDYVFKPFNPEILRSKVGVFIELYAKNEQLRRQADLLALQEMAELRRESAERYRQLADAMPQIVWTADRDGNVNYFNQRWFEYTGIREVAPDLWSAVTHPEDLEPVVARVAETRASGEVFEAEYRLRASDGTFRWHLGRAVPIRDDEGRIDFWIGTATDIHDRKRTEQAQEFLLDAGVALTRSLDYRATLGAVAKLAVPRIADWCSIELVDADGALVDVALEHGDPEKVVFAQALQARQRRRSDRGSSLVAATGETQHVRELTGDVLAEVAVDDDALALMRELELTSWISVPMRTRGRILGTISLATAESGRRFDEVELRFAEELARRAAVAVDNARLYEQAEQRARAARALETIADGVVLIDRDGDILLWNPAAEAITGLEAADVVGRSAAEMLPGYAEAADRVPLDGSRPETLPVELRDRELWLSFSAVEFDEGRVYTFRDLTEERVLEQMRADFVATVSHELRTPLAAIYGAALTIRRPDVEMAPELQERLLGVIEEEAQRLAEIVNDVLLASHLDSGQLRVHLARIDAVEVTEAVVEAARAHLPEGVTLELRRPKRVPQVNADAQQLRQVLVNLVENAVKYSPDGGPVTVSIDCGPDCVEWRVSDKGLGIPQHERQRVFEKFYRLDPHMRRGIGGTGLGLYICSELVRRLDGRIWVDGNGEQGSVFTVQIPVAQEEAKTPKRQAQAA